MEAVSDDPMTIAARPILAQFDDGQTRTATPSYGPVRYPA
jgi:sensor domain CHASE-containing protein